MRISQLKQLVQIAHYGSINKAALILDISQPTLSTNLRELENELGITLFHRTRKGITPTPDGEKVIQEARQILDSISRMETLSSDKKSESLDIATGSFFEFLIPEVVTEYRKINPTVTLRFFSFDDLNLVMDNLVKDYYRFCLTCFSTEELEYLKSIQRIKAQVLFPGISVSVLMHKNHPFAGLTSISREQLISENIIMCESGITKFYFEQIPAIRNSCKVITPNTHTMLQLLENNAGVSLCNTLVPNENPFHKYYPDIVAVPYTDSVGVAAFVTPKKAFLSKSEQDLVHVVQTVAARYKPQ